MKLFILMLILLIPVFSQSSDVETEGVRWRTDSNGKRGFSGTPPEAEAPKCDRTSFSLSWEKDFREWVKKLSTLAPNKYVYATEKQLHNLLCECRFPKETHFPSEAAIIGVVGELGKYIPGSKERIVTVKVNSERPVILIIKARRPVVWKIQATKAPVVGVLLLGYYPQKIELPGKVPVLESSVFVDGAKDPNAPLAANPCESFIYGLDLYPHITPEGIIQDDDGRLDLSHRQFLEDRSLLLFGRNLSSFIYSDLSPDVLEVKAD